VGRFFDEVSRLALSIREDVQNYYWHQFLGQPRYPTYSFDPEPQRSNPDIASLWHSTDSGGPPDKPDPAPVAPEPPPYDPMAGLKALRIERGDREALNQQPGPERDRGGPDFER
jgi:hypothetical protein